MDPVTLALIASGVLGGIFGNRGQNTQTQSKQEGRTETSTSPVYGHEENYFKNNIINSYLDRMWGNDNGYWDAYKRQGMNTLNQTEANNNNLLQKFLTSRGLGGTGAGTSAMMQSGLNSQNQKANFMNSIPLLQDQRQQSILGDMTKFFSILPYGSQGTQQSTQYGQGVGTQPSNMLGGGFTGLASMLAMLYGSGAFPGKGTPSSGGGGYSNLGGNL